MSKYLSLFIEEVDEHLQSMGRAAVGLESAPDDQEILDALFRQAHSVKGMAASMGFDDMAALAHALEDMMDDVRGRQRAFDAAVSDLLLDGVDGLTTMLEEVAKSGAPLTVGDEVTQRIRDLREAASAAESPVPAGRPAPTATAGVAGGLVTVTIVLDPETQVPGARAFLVIKKLESLGRVLATDPVLDQLKAGDIGESFSVTLGTDADDAKLGKAVDSVTGVSRYSLDRSAAPPIHTPSADADAEASAAPESAAQEPAPGELVGEVVPSPDHKSGAPDSALPSATEVKTGQTVRIRTEVLDDLIMAVGELLTVKTGMATLADELDNPILRGHVDTLGTLIRDIHMRVLDARMLPVSSIAGRFPRVVRDVARQAGKEVSFEITGDDIELDRAILERLTDPLIHILRNAVDHGLEPPDERGQLGKPRRGTVRLEARRERDLVALRITDDGRGMDPTHLAEVAVAKGFLTPEEADALTPEEAFLLTCLPGFSTATEVTFISGRGVGMDAVKSAIEELGGTLSVASSLGVGTTVQLYLPRTIAIQNVLLVRVHDQVCAIPVTKLMRTVEVETKELHQAHHTDHVMFEGEPIPVVDLGRLLQLSPRAAALEDGPDDADVHAFRANFPALVVESKNRRFALAVDDLLGQQEAFIRPLGYPLQRIEGLSGVTTLGDGSTIFVLDTMALV